MARPRIIAGGAAAVVAAVALAVRLVLAPATTAYLQPFDGAPTAPGAYRPASGFDTVVHVNDDTFTTVQAHHGPACQPPYDTAVPPHLVTHPVSAYDDAIFQCANHLMTSLWAPGYGVIYLEPAALVDFSGGAVVKLDVSTLATSDRDWWDLWITPYAEQLQLPLEIDLPDLSGPPRNAIHVRMDNFGGGHGFRAAIVRNFVETELPITDDFGYEEVLTTSASVRTTFELDLSSTSLKFGLPVQNRWWHTNTFTTLPWSQGILQIGHHSYNPDKNGGANTADTWHWKNISIDHFVPFTIIEADRRQANVAAPTLRFSAPAPASANLRFDARGNAVTVRFDGGAPVPAVRAAVTKPDQDEVFKSYWMPIPAGTTTATFAGVDVGTIAFSVRDASIHALGTTSPSPSPLPSLPSPTPAPVVTPSPTRTLAPATPSPTPPVLGTCTATWNGIVIESKLVTQANCGLR